MHTVAIVLAAGSGSRMGSDVKKQYMDLGGHTVLYHSLKAFQESVIDEIIIVASESDICNVKSEYLNDEFFKVKDVVAGGKERYNSVYEGILAAGECDYIFIHDGARPFVDNDIIHRCMACVSEYGACVAGVPSKDTVKIVDADGFVSSTPDRKNVWIIQTPQCFEYGLILEAYSLLAEAEKNNALQGINITDDAMVVEHFTGRRVKMAEGSYDNIKITTPMDMPLAETILRHRKSI